MSNKGDSYNFNRKQFNDRLKKELDKQKTKGVSQAEIARRIGVGAGTLTKYRQDEMLPGLETLSLLADFFDVSMDFLLTGKEKTSPKPYRTLKALGVLLQDLEPCISVQEIDTPAGALQIDGKDKPLALVIDDATIQRLLKKWRLYRKTAQISPEETQELKASLFTQPLKGLLSDPALQMRYGHIVDISERDAYIEDPSGELFQGISRATPSAAKMFLEDAMQDNPLRTVKFLPGSAWDLETVDKYAERIKAGEIAPWEYDQMLDDFKEDLEIDNIAEKEG